MSLAFGRRLQLSTVLLYIEKMLIKKKEAGKGTGGTVKDNKNCKKSSLQIYFQICSGFIYQDIFIRTRLAFVNIE